MNLTMTASASVVLCSLPDADIDRVVHDLEARPASSAVTVYRDLYRLEACCSVGTVSVVFLDSGTERMVVTLRLARPP